MRIGIFTDSYHPSINGVVIIADILSRGFRKLGHEVYIFAPATGLSTHSDDPYIVRLPAVNGFPSEETSTTLIFPPVVLKQIKNLHLDVMHFLTPGSIGMMGAYSGLRLGKPVVAEYCTDLFEYIDQYPKGLPLMMVFSALAPFAFKTSPAQTYRLMSSWWPGRGLSGLGRQMVKNNMTIMHERCDAVVTLSRKSAKQLRGWQGKNKYPINVIPTGVNPAPVPSSKELSDFKKTWGITPKDEVVLYLGRIGPEKNLALLVDMMGVLVKSRPNAKLVFAGDQNYRAELERLAAKSPAAGRFIFTGKVPYEKIGTVYAAGDVFAFPSITDTQALVLHEAVGAGLPVVMIDHEVTEVVHDGKNGYFCKNNPSDMAKKIATILSDPKLKARMSEQSRKYAAMFSELGQCKKTIELYESLAKSRIQPRSTASVGP